MKFIVPMTFIRIFTKSLFSANYLVYGQKITVLLILPNRLSAQSNVMKLTYNII